MRPIEASRWLREDAMERPGMRPGFESECGPESQRILSLEVENKSQIDESKGPRQGDSSPGDEEMCEVRMLKDERFWNICRMGHIVTVQSGMLQSARPRKHVREYANVPEARTAFNKKIKEKERQGYIREQRT